MIPRSSGILLHVTSLPGPYGIGDLGPAAAAWIDTLKSARQSWWQVLPLGPTGYGDSPYQCFSAFAGNPFLVSPDLLHRDGLLATIDLISDLPPDTVEFERVIPWKNRILDRAWAIFQATKPPDLVSDFERFRTTEAHWLDDFALFLAIKESHGGVSWLDWPTDLLSRQPAALKRVRGEKADRVGRHMFVQFLFARQWSELRAHARAAGVRIIGDMPIFIAGDSADVWTKPELFLLDVDRRPTVVAGVPPDYFSKTGQLWGNPHYDWSTHELTGYAWWLDRLRGALQHVDLIRLDHFRGFEAAWQVPAGNPTAEGGQWVPGPGATFFQHVHQRLGDLPLIAEDLGVITPEVDALRTQFQLPGMRILQFAFGGAREERFLPHRYERRTVVYTGTHDNDTAAGWVAKLTPAENAYFRRYVPGNDAPWDLIRSAWASVADLAIAPLQDVLGLDNRARMNTPGVPSGNWRWRAAGEVPRAAVEKLAELTKAYERDTV